MKKWDNSLDKVLIQKYPNTKNIDLANELGYHLRTIERHAARLHLKKSKEFMQQTRLRASLEGARWFEYKRLIGEKIPWRGSGKLFEKGHIPDPEIEKKRIAAIRARAWEEHKRIMHGIMPKAKWKFNLKAYEKVKERLELTTDNTTTNG